MTKLLVGALGTTIVNAAILKALAEAGHEATMADPEPVHYITAHPPCEPIDCRAWDTKKSKGDKHRDRAERRRKWGI